MEVIWLSPAAWFGLITVAVPVLIHLLTYQRPRHVAFPTLRFLRRTRLAAVRRRALQHWALLAIRMLSVAMAAGALAAPLFLSNARQQEWRQRVVRAIVVAPGAPEPELALLVDSERRDSYASEVFRPASRVADGMRDAAVWLQQQPPAAREVVVIGGLPQGTMGPADVSLVPAYAGLRFLPLPSGAVERNVDVQFQEGNALWRARATLDDIGTHVSYGREGGGKLNIAVRAAPDDEGAAAAALHAVFAAGVDRDGVAERRVVVVFDGANMEGVAVTHPPDERWMQDALVALPDMNGGASGDALIVQPGRRATPPDAAHLIERVARAVVGTDRAALEPSHISVRTLAEWSRPPGAFEGGQVQDEGDRRWLWGAVIVLMAIETVVRRSRATSPATAEVEEARVA